LSPNNIHFVLRKNITVEFAVHFHAYEIQVPVNAGTFLLSQNELLTYLPAHITKPCGSPNGTYVAPRYNVH